MSVEIKVFRCLADNIGVLLHDGAGRCVAIDAPEAAAVAAAADAAGWRLTDILVTHAHFDHVQGIPELKKRFGCQVIAPARAGDAVPDADMRVADGDRVSLGALAFEVWETPGHSADHVTYVAPALHAAFVGDVLFTFGCGRVFNQAYADMWQSLQRLMTLSDDTQIFCGHDYTLANARFALAADPDNAKLKKKIAEAETLAREGRFMVPTRLGDEKATNPFLRSGEAALAHAVGKDNAPPFEVFKALREWKNGF